MGRLEMNHGTSIRRKNSLPHTNTRRVTKNNLWSATSTPSLCRPKQNEGGSTIQSSYGSACDRVPVSSIKRRTIFKQCAHAQTKLGFHSSQFVLNMHKIQVTSTHLKNCTKPNKRSSKHIKTHLVSIIVVCFFVFSFFHLRSDDYTK